MQDLLQRADRADPDPGTPGEFGVIGLASPVVAAAGYSDLKEFQRVEVVVSDSGRR